MSLVADISAPLSLSLLGGPLFLRFLGVFSGVVLIFWISSFFHGFWAVLAFLCLWNALRDICRKLFARPAFRKYPDFQTLGLSS